MRLIKLSTIEFPKEKDLQTYFNKELKSRKPVGLFRFQSGWIAKGALYEGETLLISYRNRLRFVAKTKTERIENIYMPDPKYPYCFVIDMLSLRYADIHLKDVELKLRDHAELRKSLQAQGWTKIPDSPQAEEIIYSLVD